MYFDMMYMMHRDAPANDLAPLPPTVDIETKQVLRKAISANAELARLNGYCSLLPNVSILLNTIVLKEARASSEIENIITTQDALYEALASDPNQIDSETKEVLNYRSATWKGFSLVSESGLITTRTITSIQEELEGNNAGIRRLPGTALLNESTGTVVYTPPDNERPIRDLLSNLEEYINTEHDTDCLIKMAVIHYQFESIHPFYDGNGRTGRILNVLYLVKEHLLASPILYLSRYIIRNKPAYYDLLQRIRTANAWEEWILFMLTAVEETARLTLETIQQIVELMEATAEQARAQLPKSSYSRELIDLLFAQPYVKIGHLVENRIAERRTASKYLKQLEQIGVLESYKAWKETIYINTRLMELLRRSG